jgi:hypothetical protein
MSEDKWAEFYDPEELLVEMLELIDYFKTKGIGQRTAFMVCLNLSTILRDELGVTQTMKESEIPKA